MKKKILSLILALAMVLPLVSMTLLKNVVAAATTNADGYIEIRTIEELYNIRNDLTANYILMNDIDLTEATAAGGAWDVGGRGWNPIGSNDIYAGNKFSGIFDGNGYAIIGMRIDYDSKNKPSGIGSNAYLGLFARVEGEIRNLEMRNTNIGGGYASGQLYAGAITGSNYGTITNCSASGNISCSSYGFAVGGISGYNKGTISKCYNTANVNSLKYAGGICGYNANVINNCYNTGVVTAFDSSGYASGIANIYGTDSATPANVDSCYNTGKIKSESSIYSAISYCVKNGSATNCYYLAGTGKSTAGATVLAESDMKKQSMFKNFDFDSIWVQNSNAAYIHPQLKSNIQDDRTVIEAKIATLPNKTVYSKGQSLDTTGCTLLFKFSNTDDEVVPVTEDMVTGYEPRITGTQKLTIAHNFRTFELEVTVEGKPFQEIRTIEDLYNIRDNLTGNYILMNDIDLTEATAEGGAWDYNGRGWNPIGSNDTYSNLPFSGEFNGNGKKIIGLRIGGVSTSESNYVGLFSNVTGFVQNLEMKNVNISGGKYAGSIAASASDALIRNCKVSGELSKTKESSGGLVGKAENVEISNCVNSANITGGAYVGGLVGEANTVTVDTSFNNGIITAKYGNGYYYYKSGNWDYGYTYCYFNYASGIIGKGESSTVTNCYNTGNIKTETNTDRNGYSYYAYAYGISYGAMSNTSYNIGACENAIGSSNNSYYLESKGSSSSATSLTEAQMKMQSMYRGFDFENTWVIDPYAVYPYPQLRNNIQDMSEAAELVSLLAWPAKTEYFVGDRLDFTGALLRVVYASGREEIINITEDMVSGFDMNTAGEQTVIVTVGGASDSFTIQVTERPAVSAITIASEPNIKKFVVGTAFDFTGAKALITYEGGATEYKDITAEVTTGGNINRIGKQTITYTYDGKSATFEVEVVGVSLEKIVVTTLPTKLTYHEGEDFDPAGMVVSTHYNNNMSVAVTGYTVSGYDSTPGKKTITVSYSGFEATFEVEVTAHTYDNIYDKACNVCGAERSSSITDASFELSSSINANLYAKLAANHTTAKMRFTMHGKQTVVDGVKTDRDGIWKFQFKKIAPQCMGDTFKAELILGDVVLDTLEDYSVRSYCDMLFGSSASELNITQAKFNAAKTMMADLLEYGAMAQIFKNYKTDALVNEGITGQSMFKELEAALWDKELSATTTPGTQFTGANVWFDNENKLYFMFKAPGCTETNFSVKVTDSDTGVTNEYTLSDFEVLSAEDSHYGLLSEPVPVAHFGHYFTITLNAVTVDRRGNRVLTEIQTLDYYGINAYIYAMQNKRDAGGELTPMAMLARAAYCYGDSAAAYDAI